MDTLATLELADRHKNIIYTTGREKLTVNLMLSI